jgi:hypothetical protein
VRPRAHAAARKLHAEKRAAAILEIRGQDASAVQLDQVAHDREPEAQAPVSPRARGIGLPKALEDVGQEVRVDAGTVVLDG